jgi:hypothetical protein
MDFISKTAIQRYVSKFGLEELRGKNDRLQELESEVAILERKIQFEVSAFLTNLDKNVPYRASFSNIETLAKGENQEIVLTEFCPEYQDELERLNNLKSDVRGTVLLATTEPKLVVALEKLLQKYGGDIEELKEFVL